MKCLLVHTHHRNSSNMQLSFIKKYIVKKLNLKSENEVTFSSYSLLIFVFILIEWCIVHILRFMDITGRVISRK